MKRATRRRSLWSVALLAAPLVLAGCASLPSALGGDPPPTWEQPPPPPSEGPIVEAGALHRATLDNGLTILILEDRRLPRVALGLELLRGAGSVAPEKAGIAAITSEVLQRGAPVEPSEEWRGPVRLRLPT